MLGRDSTEYAGAHEGEEHGYAWRSEVRVVAGGPFVLRRSVVDAAHPEMSARTEVIELDDGPVPPGDL
jgi:hypothetical protein